MPKFLRENLAGHRLAAGVLLLVLTATIVAAWVVDLRQRSSRERHEHDSLLQIRMSLEDQLRHYRQMLATTRALFQASDSVSPQEWQMFLTTVGYPEECPGFSALGFVERVPVSEKDAEGDKRLLTMLSTHRGEFHRPGWDLGSLAIHRAVMDRALRENRPVMGTFWGHPDFENIRASDKPAENDVQPRYAIYLPVVDPTSATPPKGWIVASVRITALVDHLRNKLPGVVLEIPQDPLVNRGVRSQLLEQYQQDSDLLLPFAGKMLHLRILSGQGLSEDSSPSLPLLILLCGMLMAGTLATVTWSLVATRSRALRLAEQMTKDLHNREAEVRKLALVAARTDHAVFICDAERKIEWINDGFTQLTGFTLDAVAGRRVSQTLLDPDIDPEFLEDCRRQLLEGKPIHLEIRIRTKTGSLVWVTFDSQGVFDDKGRLTNVIGLMRDISERKNAEDRLLHLSLHDALTGLPNRVMLMDRLQQALQRHQRHPERRFALIFLDLDRFKLINDSLGHACGDLLLKTMAARLTRVLRSQDMVARQEDSSKTVARLGGDEFVVLLEDISSNADALRIADRLQKELSSPVDLDGQEVVTTVSMGIALSDLGYTHPQEVLRDADNAMYRAKSLGKARYQVFDQQMHEAIRTRLELENQLRKSIDRGEFVLLYQPIYCLESRRIVGWESLVRWQHPQRGLVAPGDFIPIAEETGLIVPLGKWILLEACRQLMRWQAKLPQRSDVGMSVNLSVKQISDPDLPSTVRQILQATGIDPRCLKLEITESAIMEDQALMRQTLHQLKQLGVQLYMDDFGTGYSSLSCLHQFPIDGLKIDRAFIQSMGQRSDYAAVVQAIVSLAHHLEMKVVAEGLENATQLLQLQTLDADHGQGYFFAPPIPAEQAEVLLRQDGRSSLSRAV